MNIDKAKRELISYRLKQAKEALQDAMTLASHGGTPRTMVNRSYYAMYYATLALMVSVDESVSKHSGAISLFDKHFVRSGLFPKELSKSLHWAFRFRQQSDYQEMFTVSPEDASEAIARADEFITAIRTYLHDKGFVLDL